ncbi:TonB-dependent siderophore receptor [Stutzerimonas kirkiae]|uniref:TonB-dependent siderophore receptor n=1 Tax=Stutzerimonas kirkiae TaxID=2211392 RepID=UPI001F622E6C|nr:TonB-dependent receptor [Stutzerimonas kirkiae]
MILSFAAGQTAGLASPGLRGRYSVDEGLARLLVGSGLYAQRQGNGGYVLVSVAPGDALELGATSITGNALGARTEGAGSYTSGSSNSATRLNLSIRETPQSISVVTRQRMDDEQLTSIETLLDRTPGISVQNIGTSRYGISSRGYSIDTIQLDGVLTALDLVSQNIPQTQADLVIYDRVEVLRGAAGLLTGAGDPSGTINLVRKKPTQAFQGYVGFSLGSRDRYRSEVDVSGPLGAATGLRGRFVGAHEQGGTQSTTTSSARVCSMVCWRPTWRRRPC